MILIHSFVAMSAALLVIGSGAANPWRTITVMAQSRHPSVAVEGPLASPSEANAKVFNFSEVALHLRDQ